VASEAQLEYKLRKKYATTTARSPYQKSLTRHKRSLARNYEQEWSLPKVINKTEKEAHKRN